jgi:cathepsin L
MIQIPLRKLQIAVLKFVSSPFQVVIRDSNGNSHADKKVIIRIIATQSLTVTMVRLLGSLLLVSWLTSTLAKDFAAVINEYDLFDQFAIDFHKRYEDAEEYELRRAVFESNRLQILQHNNLKLEQNVAGGHVLAINAFADLLPHELFLGYDKSQSANHRSSISSSNTNLALERTAPVATFRRVLTAADLLDETPVSERPDTVDWRTRGVTTPIKSQGKCGSCWAFASAACLESHIALQTGVLFTFSEQELVSCAPNKKQCGGSGGCTGATAELAFDFVQKHGIVSEWTYGYESFHGVTGQCKLTNNTGPLRGSKSGLFTDAVAAISGFAAMESNSYDAVMNAVAKLGPITVSVAAHGWRFYKSGVYSNSWNETGAADINHLVVLEGYGTDQETGEDFWLVRNSWGPLWGEGGYIRLKRVDPSTLEDPYSDCDIDTTPADGVGCTEDDNGDPVVPTNATVCGTSGILFDTAVPLGGYLV